ncbi:hypothetical protein ACIFOC_03082 [Leucobacter aridicollis]|uniref:alpha/beta hydrolase n=1 Tax=Leucobacter aridicollis TaxID=283878 RepID=UPI0037C85920
MTTHVPTAADVLNERVSVGSASEARSIAGEIATVRRSADRFGIACVQAQAALEECTGRSVGAIARRLQGSLIPGAAIVSDAAASAARAFERYAGRVAELDDEARRVHQGVVAWLDSISGAVTEIERICDAILAPPDFSWDRPPSPTLPQPRLRESVARAEPVDREAALALLQQHYEALWRNTVLCWQGDVYDVRAAADRWRELGVERRAAERALAAALGDTSIGHLIAVSPAGLGERARVIAVGLTGEFAGVRAPADAPGMEHELLAGLFPTTDGSSVWHSPPDAKAVAAWWQELAPEQRADLIASVPLVIGNLPGLAGAVRDSANRLMIEFYRTNPGLLSIDQLKLVAEVQRILDRTDNQARPQPPVHLYSFSLTESAPMVAMSYGDIDSATHVTVQVAGMGNDAHEGLATWDVAALELYDAQRARLRRGLVGGPAVVAWLGYDTPGLPPRLDVLSSTAAEAGAGRLRAELDGIAALPKTVPRATSVVAHSYGTTLASIALTKVETPVDTFVMLGSAGIDVAAVPTIDRLRVRSWGGQPAVYATTAPADKLAPTGAGLSRRALPEVGPLGLLGVQRRSSVLEGVTSFKSSGDPAAGYVGTDGHSIIGSGSDTAFLGASASTGRGYGDRTTQALAMTAQLTTQSASPPTRQLREAVASDRPVASEVCAVGAETARNPQ